MPEQPPVIFANNCTHIFCRECLEVLHEPSLIFSQKETLLIHEALPSMHLINFRLTLMQIDSSGCLHPVTQVAACSALTVVEKYIKLLGKSDGWVRALEARQMEVPKLQQV
ncbi:hypothetical protein FRC12_000432 [Ceratobasidium sp. 428]|nr:hypothetical protein FRC12_000432 [Ceratobasidium sp. 428]